jgi:5'-3' exonuclease
MWNKHIKRGILQQRLLQSWARMILLVDADSLIFASCYRKRETPDENPYFEKLSDASDKFNEQLMGIVNHLEDFYDIDKVIIFNGSKGNFRKLITKKYKANRKDAQIPPLLNEMHQWVKDNHNSVYGYGVETDDMVARYWNDLSKEFGRDEVMIVSIDKDYKQFPCLMYNYHYKHKQVLDISEDEALYNFYEQMIIGDSADNVNYFRGRGFAEKYLADCKSHYQYTKRMYKLFKEEYKGKAKQRYIECYNLLKLRTNYCNTIYNGLNKGGALILCEKIYQENGLLQEILTFTHYEHKCKEFTELEIIKKEKDLRFIMKPNSFKQNIELLNNSGFTNITTFWQSYNFIGLIAIK